MNRRSPAFVALALLTATAVQAQVYVQPRQPERSLVRSYRFEWRHIDLLVGPEAKGELTEREPRAAHQQVPGTPLGATPAAPRTSTDPSLPPENQAPPQPQTPTSPTTPPPSSPTVVSAPDGGTPDGGAVAAADGGTPDGGAALAGAADGGADGGTLVMESDKPPYLSDAGIATTLEQKAGGVRLYFYERERQVAERAAPLIENAYRYLVQTFNYVPAETFPYVLFSSYQEFLQNTVLPVSEGTLGVTSPLDLTLSLPYLGDNQLFERVGTHELTHEFTIQKVRSMAKAAKVTGNPLGGMPLWFIEGLAEYYTWRGMDDETDMLVRDLLVNPDVYRGYAMLDFFEQGPANFLWIYKVGQARCAFLEETYGKGTIQQILELSPQLVGGAREAPSVDFPELLERITGDKKERISERFQEWLKRRSFRAYLENKQDAPTLDAVKEDQLEGYVTALNASPDGQVIAYRSIMPTTGESRLVIASARVPETNLTVVEDGAPGYESLHPTFGRNFDLSADRLVFTAEVGARDVLYVQGYKAETRERKRDERARFGPPGAGQPGLGTAPPPPPRRAPGFVARLGLDHRQAFPLGEKGLIAAFSPSFSPDGQRIAFIGLAEAGTRDVYVLDPQAGPDAPLLQVTHDAYTERELTWTEQGIVFTSDATSHRKFNLFRVRPEAPDRVERLTTEPRDESEPVALPNGRLFFTAYTGGSHDLHEVTPQGVVRRTDMTTGVFEASPGIDGGLWMLLHKSGARTPALLRTDRMLDLPAEPQPKAEPPAALAIRPLDDAQKYRPFALENVDLGPIIGFAGGGSEGIVGQLFGSATDKLRGHGVLLALAVYGRFDLTDGLLLYVNQERRLQWGAGIFQQLRLRFDRTFEAGDQGFIFTSGERFYGATVSARYPLSTFTYVGADVSLGGVSYFLDPYTAFNLYIPSFNPVGRDLYTPWLEANRKARAQAEMSLSAGYNTLRWASLTSPTTGSAALLELSGGVQPFNSEVFSNVRLDAERYFPIIGRLRLMTRLGVGGTFGGRYARPYFLSSWDTLRGVNFGDERFLLGNHYLYSTAELKVPLDALVRVAFLSDIEAVAGFDAGGVGRSARDTWNGRVVNAALGVNFGLGPLIFRLHFARPFDVGAERGLPVEREGQWVTNFSLGLAGYGAFFDQKDDGHPRRPPPGSAFAGSGMIGPRTY